jgi:hypothetical protein
LISIRLDGRLHEWSSDVHCKHPPSLVAIYPIFIAVRLRQDCKQNYIFITVRLLYNVTKILPKSRQDCYTILPGLPQNLAKISPGVHNDLARIATQSRQNLTGVALRSLQNLAGVALRSRHSCTTMFPRLAGLLYDLTTVALRCFQDSQDCYTISLQLHYDVSKTHRKIAIQSRFSCTTMSPRLAGLPYDLATYSCTTMSPRLAGLLYDKATVALRCP